MVVLVIGIAACLAWLILSRQSGPVPPPGADDPTTASATSPRIRPARIPLHDHIRYLVIRRSGFRCHYCGATGKLEVDHIIPLAAGGTNDMSNLVAACPHCNRSKGARARPKMR